MPSLYLTQLALGLNVSPFKVNLATKKSLPDSYLLTEFYTQAAKIAAAMIYENIDYNLYAGRLQMYALHLQNNLVEEPPVALAGEVPQVYLARTKTSFLDYIQYIKDNEPSRIHDAVLEFVKENAMELEEIIDYQKDFDLDYPAVATFMSRCLEPINGIIAETPNQKFLRCALGLNVYQSRSAREMEEFQKVAGFVPDMKRLQNMTTTQRLANIKEYYDLISDRKISLPGPILMHAGSQLNQMASCFIDTVGDSLADDEYSYTGVIGGIFRSLTDLAVQSKGGGGNAHCITNVRAKGSKVLKSNGKSNGIIPFMKMFDSVIAGIDQSGKRAGTIVLTNEIWHADILDFLESAKHNAVDEIRCKHIFLALFGNDVFFSRLYDAVSTKQLTNWTLINPHEAKNILGYNLSEVYGEQFRKDYEKLELMGVGKKINILDLWQLVCEVVRQNGFPYILNKDAINKKSNQKNLGAVNSSNLCCEIALYSNDTTETAVCVLSGICLGRFVKEDKTVDFEGIINAARLATRNLNGVIDMQFYPNPKTRNSCLQRRAIGIGAQGLADLFAQLNYNFTSPEAKELNKKVYECIYYGCLLESMELAKVEGAYTGFEGSPVSKGILQYDMWGLTEKNLMLGDKWLALKADIIKYGIRNSEVTALAPTASSSVRMSNNEMHEPFSRNIYIKSTICGEVRIVNPYLVADMGDDWNQGLANKIIVNRGSVSGIAEVPAELQEKYKNAYELDYKDLIDMMADRSPFVSQSSSFNHFVYTDQSLMAEFTKRVLYGWKKGLKTISYYCHTGSVTTGASLFVESDLQQAQIQDEEVEVCEVCSS